MKSLAVVALSILFIPLLPMVSATPDAPSGLNAVVMDDGDPQEVRFKFLLSDNHTTGFQYNLTVDSSGPVDLGNVSTFDDYEETSTYIQFTWKPEGPTAAYDAWIHGWDGSTEGDDSCTVSIDTGVLGDYDGCGDYAPAYEQAYCLDVEADDFGFGITKNVRADVEEEKLIFRSANLGQQSAYGGINLGGDTEELRFNFTILARTDGGTSKALFFFSEVNRDVSHISIADGESTMFSDFAAPNEGSFQDGVGVLFTEDGPDYEVRVFSNTAGATTLHHEDTWSDGITEGEEVSGSLTVSEYLDILTVSLGDETVSFSLDTQVKDTENLQALWILEVGPSSLVIGTSTEHTADGTSGCLYTLPSTLGGAVIEIGDPGGQSLENFEGSGGFGGNPSFPGLDVQSTADSWGMEPKFLGYTLASILVGACALLGFLVARGPGTLVVGTLGFLATVVLNLVPYWFLILLLLGAVAVVVMNFRGQAA